MNTDEQIKEFDRQVENLLQKGYPKLVGMSQEEFLKLITPLREKLNGLDIPEVDIEKGKLPFVIVIKSGTFDAEKAMELVEQDGKKGNPKLFPRVAKEFTLIESVTIPEQIVYLLVDIDRGKETLNVRPEDALKTIQNQNRSPLTIDEGIALMTQFPEFLIKNNCFSLLASRFKGDQRVPAIWINNKKQPHLGWCWDRNPHTWLGSASAKLRKA